MLVDPDQSVLRTRLPPTSSADPTQAQLYKVWGAGMQLQPGETLEWPLLIHPTVTGKLAVHCLWYCEPTVRSAGERNSMPLHVMTPVVFHAMTCTAATHRSFVKLPFLSQHCCF